MTVAILTFQLIALANFETNVAQRTHKTFGTGRELALSFECWTLWIIDSLFLMNVQLAVKNQTKESTKLVAINHFCKDNNIHWPNSDCSSCISVQWRLPSMIKCWTGSAKCGKHEAQSRMKLTRPQGVAFSAIYGQPMWYVIELRGEADLFPHLVKIVQSFHGRIDVTNEALMMRKYVMQLTLHTVLNSVFKFLQTRISHHA